MLNRRKRRCWSAADPLSRRIRRHELGIFVFQRLEALHQLIELEVGDFGRVLDVVEPFVTANILAQSFGDFPES